MNITQKQRIQNMRNKSESYATIAETLDISENTVKSYCRRNNLGAGYIKEQTIDKSNDSCDNCSKPLIHTPGTKKKRFCSDKCRMAWWANHPEAINRKAVYRITCPICGMEYESYGNAHRKYCSRACFGSARSSSDD